MEREKDRLRFSIGRFDHYYDSVNNKCNVFLALSIFIFGALGGFYPTLMKIADCGACTHTLMTLMMFICVLIMIVVLRASSPYITSEKDSLLYFNSVSNMEQAEFSKLSEDETKDRELVDLRNQTFLLATGLRGKFEKLKVAGILFTLQFILFIPLTLLIINNLKIKTL